MRDLWRFMVGVWQSWRPNESGLSVLVVLESHTFVSTASQNIISYRSMVDSEWVMLCHLNYIWVFSRYSFLTVHSKFHVIRINEANFKLGQWFVRYELFYVICITDQFFTHLIAHSRFACEQFGSYQSILSYFFYAFSFCTLITLLREKALTLRHLWIDVLRCATIFGTAVLVLVLLRTFLHFHYVS